MSEEIQNTPESIQPLSQEPQVAAEHVASEKNPALEEQIFSEPESNAAETPAVQESAHQEAVPSAQNAPPSQSVREKRQRPASRKRAPNREHVQKRREGPSKKRPPFERFVTVTWSGMREPVDDMYWAEAELEGDWIIVREVMPVRTRKEILERLIELPNGLVSLEFNFGYPKPFVDFLTPKLGIENWRALIKRVREDLKKNVDDGIRLWIERMGEYRESELDTDPPPSFQRGDYRGGDRRFNDRPFGNRSEPLPPYEQRSVAERFRRADLTIRKAAGQNLISPIQIAYNRLTKRYEFNDPNVRGRASLIGMSMLDQFLEARPEVAVWPMSRPKALSVVELQPWIFTNGRTLPPEELRRTLALYEDNGWDIPANARDAAARNEVAQRALLSLIGIIKTELRQERERRPLRDYVDLFYNDPQVQTEGWLYSIGYRVSDDQRGQQTSSQQSSAKKSRQESTIVSENGESLTTQEIETPADASALSTENPIVLEASMETLEHTPAPESAEVQAAE